MPSVGIPVLHGRAVDRGALHPHDVHADRAIAAEAAEGQEFRFPQLYKEQTTPATASFERGKAIYANMCTQCHGMAGNGRGPDGLYLRPRPANLQDQAKDLDSPAAPQQHPDVRHRELHHAVVR